MAQSRWLLWFKRLHSEKPTTVYNLMSQNVRSGATTALWSSSGPCEKTGNRLVRTLPSVTATWIQGECACLAKTALEPGEMVTISMWQTTECGKSFGTSWIKQFISLEVNGGDKSGYGTEQGGSCEAGTEWKIKLSPPPQLHIWKKMKHSGNTKSHNYRMYNMSAVCRKQMHSFDYFKNIYLYAHTLLYSG